MFYSTSLSSRDVRKTETKEEGSEAKEVWIEKYKSGQNSLCTSQYFIRWSGLVNNILIVIQIFLNKEQGENILTSSLILKSRL